MSSAELTLDAIAPAGGVEAILGQFVPPRRFARTTFESYRPDPRFPSQALARDEVCDYAAAPPPKPPGWLERLGLAPRRPAGVSGLYLDGGYGVGKTHLLAAAYRAFTGPKAYLTFQELTYTLLALGRTEGPAAFGRYRLLCLDEFELDDLGNTMLVASLFRQLAASELRIVTTSNTLPTELGQGRFHADDFKREIGEIAASFTPVTIDGEDYRQRRYNTTEPPPGRLDPARLRATHEAYRPAEGAKVWATFEELLAVLARHHPIRFAQLVAPIEALFLDGVAPISDQDAALRFVHFVDKLYDQQRRLALSANCALADIFPARYRELGFRQKFGRCESRLRELLDEAGAFL